MTTQRVSQSTTKISHRGSESESSLSKTCGNIKDFSYIDNRSLQASIQGQNPWMVAVYRNMVVEKSLHYKCTGTIIGKRRILTSVNCLLEEGRLLKPRDLKVNVEPTRLQVKLSPLKWYDIEHIITHEDYNFNLDNNIAMLRLSHDIEFNNFVQPICLPASTYNPEGIGKVC